MAEDHAKMRGFIKQLKSLDKFTRQVVDEAGNALEREVLASASRQQAPTGAAWTASKTGERVLRNVASNMRKTISGDVVTLTLSGHYARHHLGAVKGKIQRRILPSRNVPKPISGAIAQAITREFEKVMR